MSDAVWVSHAPRRDLGIGFTFIPRSKREAMRDIDAQLEDATRKHLWGMPVDLSTIPDRIYWDAPGEIPKSLPNVFSTNFLCFSEKLTEILGAYGVDESELKPVELFDRDMKTSLGKTVWVFLPRCTAETIDLEKSKTTELWEGSELLDLPAELKPGENVFLKPEIRETAPVWTDPRIWRLVFFRNDLAEALISENLERELFLQRL